ncbi:hypothetical protein [Emticicia sp. 17c]|uniref:hypothetical protein n=1 Tax=Emticicia sp. 17c TaxID=3127704 RepID=UPI00301C171F
MEILFDPDFIGKSILALLGVLISYMEQLSNAKKQKVRYVFKNEWPGILLTMIVTLVMVYLREDIKELYVVTNFGAVILGYSGSSFFLSILKSKLPRNENI